MEQKNAKKEIQKLLKDFHKISGMRISIHSSDLVEQYGYPEKTTGFCTALQRNKKARGECLFQDNAALNMAKATGKPYVYECHCGLWEAVVPIYHFDILAGFLMVGQAAIGTLGVYDKVREKSRSYFESEHELTEALKTLTVIPNDKCESFLSLMVVLSEYIASKSLLLPEENDLAINTMSYIDRHYSDDLSLTSLCEEMRCSKSTLMKAFRERYKKSVGDAIREVRLRNAVRYLSDREVSVKTIAIACVFFDQNYFAKVFKAQFGMSPSQYRKTIKD